MSKQLVPRRLPGTDPRFADAAYDPRFDRGPGSGGAVVPYAGGRGAVAPHVAAAYPGTHPASMAGLEDRRLQQREGLGMRTARIYQDLPFSHASAFITPDPDRMPVGRGVRMDMMPPDTGIVGPAGAVAGRRQTSWGSFGRQDLGIDGIPVASLDDIRMQAQRLSYGPAAPGANRMSGIVTSASGASAWSQRVPRDRAQLVLRATGEYTILPPGTSLNSYTFDGNARLLVTAGVDGGMESQREFFIGGGLTANLVLDAYDYVKVSVLQLSGGQVQFAWTKPTASGNQTLYMPENVESDPSVGSPVPEGAYAVAVGYPSDSGAPGPGSVAVQTKITWTTDRRNLSSGAYDIVEMISYVGYDTPSGESYYKWGEPVPVLGTDFWIATWTGGGGAPAGPIEYQIVWFLRSF
jgi:hypothetical protein